MGFFQSLGLLVHLVILGNSSSYVLKKLHLIVVKVGSFFIIKCEGEKKKKKEEKEKLLKKSLEACEFIFMKSYYKI